MTTTKNEINSKANTGDGKKITRSGEAKGDKSVEVDGSGDGG